MAQEDMKQNDRGGFPRMRPGGDANGPRKGPRFSIYWVWGAIAVILVGFNLFGSFTPDAKEIFKLDFTNTMLANGDVESFVIVPNKNLVKVYIKKR
jgi:cell division protease FtsH